jgi:hypothetical protein
MDSLKRKDANEDKVNSNCKMKIKCEKIIDTHLLNNH